MDIDTLQSIYAHASWANEKLFDTAAQITAGSRTPASFTRTWASAIG